MDALRELAQQRNDYEQHVTEVRAKIDQLILDLLKAGHLREDIAKWADVSITKVQGIAKNHGIPRRKPGPPKGRRPAHRSGSR